jgi:hypothetical protein
MVLTRRLDTVLEGRREPVFSFEFFPATPPTASATWAIRLIRGRRDWI